MASRIRSHTKRSPLPSSQIESKADESSATSNGVADLVVPSMASAQPPSKTAAPVKKPRAAKASISTKPTTVNAKEAAKTDAMPAKSATRKSKTAKTAKPNSTSSVEAEDSPTAIDSSLETPASEPQNLETPATPVLSTSAMWAREAALRPGVPSVRKSGAPAEGEFERVFALWRETGDPQLRDRLILMHRNLVSYLARRFTDRGEMYEDIIQQGLIGLINALDHFDPKRGVRFATFATPTIVGEIRRYFRDKTWSVRVPRRLQELHQTINRKIEALTQELGRSPTYAEIARSLGVEEEQVVEALEMAQALDPASLDEPTSGEDGSGVAIVDQVGGNDVNLERLNEFSQLKAALEQLTPRQQTVLQLAYFEGFSQAEIARHIKVSPMHVSRLQRRALAQLREILEEQN